MVQPIARRSPTILIDTIRKKNSTSVEKLLERGTNVDGVDPDGNYPLHHAIFSHNVKIVQLLLEYGAYVDPINYSGLRPYNIAVELRDFPIIEVLLKYRARVNIDELRYYLLEFPKEIVDLFYKYVDVNAISFFGFTALHRVVECDEFEGVQKLILNGADVNKTTLYEGYSPLHLARSARCIEFLLQKGAKIDLKDKYSCTPLYAVAMQDKTGRIRRISTEERERMIEILFSNGADGIDVLFAGQIALDYDRDWESMEGFRYVLRYMALVEHTNQYTARSDLGLNDRTSVLSCFYGQCLEEVRKMREEIIFNTITFYDFAIRGINELSCYVRNKEVVETFQKNEAKPEVQFPIYRRILERHFSDAMERRNLREAASSALSVVAVCIDSSHIATQHIINLLEIRDMHNFVSACQPLVLKNAWK